MSMPSSLSILHLFQVVILTNSELPKGSWEENKGERSAYCIVAEKTFFLTAPRRLSLLMVPNSYNMSVLPHQHPAESTGSISGVPAEEFSLLVLSANPVPTAPPPQSWRTGCHPAPCPTLHCAACSSQLCTSPKYQKSLS